MPWTQSSPGLKEQISLHETRDTALKQMKYIWCIGLLEIILQWINFIPLLCITTNCLALKIL